MFILYGFFFCTKDQIEEDENLMNKLFCSAFDVHKAKNLSQVNRCQSMNVYNDIKVHSLSLYPYSIKINFLLSNFFQILISQVM